MLDANNFPNTVEHVSPPLGGSFRWHDGLLIGDSRIDEDHRRFFGYFDLAALVGDDPEALEPLFLEILADLGSHLAAEEQILAEIGYPGAGSHRTLHRMLGEQAKAALAIGRDGEWKTALRLLATSVLEHMAEDDVKVRPFLAPPLAI